MATGNWYLLKFMPNLVRREPRNIGVALEFDGLLHFRFVGEDPDTQKIDGHALRAYQLPTQPYREWVSYFRRKSSLDAWGDVAEALSYRPSNFMLEPGGRVTTKPDSWSDAMDELFRTCVMTSPQSVETTPGIDYKIDQILELSRLKDATTRDVVERAKFDGNETEIVFPYGIQNGSMHLGERLQVTDRRSVGKAMQLRSQIEGVRSMGNIDSFVVFYSSGTSSEELLDNALIPIEKVARPIDVNKPDDAVASLEELIGH